MHSPAGRAADPAGVASPAGDAPRFRTFCRTCGRGLDDGYAPLCGRCGGMADVAYDLGRARLHDSPNPFLRFRHLLPVADPGLLPRDARFTPTVHATRLGDALGMPWLYLKDETGLPTGTTKDRMAAVALAYLYERGVRGFCTSSTGNSSTAFAGAIARLPGLRMYLFTAAPFRDRVAAGATDRVVQFWLRDASFEDAFDCARWFAARHGLVSERGFFNPGRREGLKLAWLEAAEQVPRPIDWYVQAVSSGMGVYGTAQGAGELLRLGRIDRAPRLLCVQQATCAPMVAAWNDGSPVIRPAHIVHRPSGIAAAILRGDPSRSYPHLHRLVVESHGTFAAAGEREIRDARRMVEDLEGLAPCYSASTALAGLVQLVRRGEVSRHDTVLVNLTGRDRRHEPAAAAVGWLRRSGSGWVPA